MSSLDQRLRSTLTAARCNTEVRDRLRELVDDHTWLDGILAELGKGHALVRELLWITKGVA